MTGWRPPTWLVVACALLALGGAVWLFARDASEHPPTEPQADASASVDPELRLPEGGAATNDSRRRGKEGRRRAADEDAAEDDEDVAETAPAPAEDAALLRNLRDTTVVLAPAGATTAGPPARAMRVGPVATTCGVVRNATGLAAELALLDRVERQLEAAGARSIRLDEPESHTVPCRPARATAFHAGDWFLVVAATARTAVGERVLPARPSTAARTAEAALRTTFTRELAAALHLPVAARQGPAAATAALQAGAVDLPGGAVGVVYQLHMGVETRDLDIRATALVRGIAATIARTPDR